MTAVQPAPAAQASPKAFGVWFKDLDLWSPSSFFEVAWHWPGEVIKPLSTAITQRKDSVTLKGETESLPIIEKITFGGVLSIRSREKRKNYKGRLFWAHSGDLVFSKIRIKQGSISIISKSLEHVAVSAEYPVYEIDEKIAIPAYLLLLVRTKVFMQMLGGKSHGGSSKTRIKPETVEATMVPLPPLHIQQAIVDRWQQAQREIAEGTARLATASEDILIQLRKQLGREVDKQSKPKAFALQWKDLERWGVDMCWQSTRIRSEAHFPLVTIGDLCKVGSGGTPSRKNPNYFKGTIPWVKTTEVRDSVIHSTEEHISELGLESSSAKLYPKGSILVAMYGQGATRGRTAKLGIEATTNQACAVLTSFSNDVNPDFLWYYLMSEYHSLRELASGNNQPNLNAAMVSSYPVPLPPLDIQKTLVTKLEQRRAEIALERKRLETKAEKIERSVSNLILGLESI